MISISAKIRKEVGKKVKEVRKQGNIPAVLYGPGVENLSLEVDLKEFQKVFKEAGENSLIEVSVDSKKFLVLIHDLEIDSLTQNPLHVDFYQPKLDKEIVAEIPLVFEGESFAIKDLGGTLVKNIHALEVKAFPQNLPHEIKVNIDKLKVFGDTITVGDLGVSENVKILKELDEIIALVAEPQKVEEELEKPIEEKVEDVEKVEEKKEEVEETTLG
ncbi:MAG: 50S ribosomal protein L25 [Candidatus Nealsonbacteria bacterium]